jgi:CO/xanthine dehydrogenase FAD-binding subunit
MVNSFAPSAVIRPKTLAEAAQILFENRGGSARIVAGNTFLYDLAGHEGLTDVKLLLDLSNLGLSFIRQFGSGVKIGAYTTFTEVANSPLALVERRGLDALWECCSKITPPQVRNMGTVGGSLCSGVPFFDFPTTALALEPEITAYSMTGERKYSAREHFIDYFQTAVREDEVLTEVSFSYSLTRRKSASSFAKLGRTEVDFAVVNVACYLELEDDDECAVCRIVLGSVANTPVRWQELENHLLGKKISAEVLTKAIREVKVDLNPMPMVHATSEYKKMVIPIVARDCLLETIHRIECLSVN